MLHIVVQGDHMSGIAKQHGFSDYRTIWNHAHNADLKKKRVNPNVLYPGDEVFIPEREDKQVHRSTDQEHKFLAKRSKLKLAVVIEESYRNPLADTPCQLIVDNESFNLNTDAKGKIEHDVSPTAKTGGVIVKDPQSPLNDVVIPIKIGHLDPVDETSGQTGRLNNLGYFAGPLEDRSAEDNKQAFQSAVEEFQCDHGLKVDGICGPQTQAKLKEAHGC